MIECEFGRAIERDEAAIEEWKAKRCPALKKARCEGRAIIRTRRARAQQRAHRARPCGGSHAGKSWETFTDSAITRLSEGREHLVFILWGSYAMAKRALIDSHKHLVIASPHPSPFSAHKGFFGSKPFSRANAYLQAKGKEPIAWA